MRFTCRVAKVAEKHLECVIILAFAWQNWIRQRTSMLCF